jgi:hypothetical protein
MLHIAGDHFGRALLVMIQRAEDGRVLSHDSLQRTKASSHSERSAYSPNKAINLPE